jgi:hypothetical protein
MAVGGSSPVAGLGVPVTPTFFGMIRGRPKAAAAIFADPAVVRSDARTSSAPSRQRRCHTLVARARLRTLTGLPRVTAGTADRLAGAEAAGRAAAACMLGPCTAARVELP